jgi:hypothetical protein
VRGHVAFELQTPLALKLFIETWESGQSASRHVPCTRSKAKLCTGKQGMAYAINQEGGVDHA